MAAENRDKDSETVAFIGISSGNQGEHEYQQLSMEDRLVEKVRLFSAFMHFVTGRIVLKEKWSVFYLQ